MNRLACLALGAALAAPALAQSASYTVAEEVEPEVREAFAAAWARLPAPHRGRLVELGLTLRRAPAMEPAPGAPLAARLMARATHAWFSTRERAVVVTDAALGGPRWEGPAPDAPALAAFLHGLEDALEVDCAPEADLAGLTPAWRAFVARVAERLPGEWPTPAQTPPGDPSFLTRFLSAGVAASLGGATPGLEALLVHELGHALQLGPDGEVDRIASWSTLSEWREGTQRKPADGFVGGAWGHERPRVLIRVLLGAPRGDDATFAPHPDARFPTPYARFDPREDFAECYRLALTDPDALAQAAPEKLLALNAAGWSAGAKAEPLFAEARPSWREPLTAGVRRLLARERPAPSTRDARAILEAAAPLLEGLELDAGQPAAFELPADLPQPVREAWGEGPPGVEVGGRTLYLGDARLAGDVEELLRRFQTDVDFASGIARLRRELDPEASLAEVLDGRTDDAALAFLGSLLDDESPARLERWFGESEDAQHLLILCARMAQAPDDPDLAKAFRAQERPSAYAASLAAELLLGPELAAAAQETPSTPVRLALHLLEGQPGASRVLAARARALALFARSSPEPERAEPAARARAAAAGIALPGLRSAVEAQLETLLGEE